MSESRDLSIWVLFYTLSIFFLLVFSGGPQVVTGGNKISSPKVSPPAATGGFQWSASTGS